MKGHTNVQVIKQSNKPAFVVLPYQDWLEITKEMSNEADYIPHEVVGIQLEDSCSLIAAWRKYRKLTQSELGKKLALASLQWHRLKAKTALQNLKR